MELNGEDKRILALFCELKREDERTVPLFATTWNIAAAEFHRTGSKRLRQSSATLPRLAMAMLVVSLVLAATILLPKYLRVSRQSKSDHAEQGKASGLRINSLEPPRSAMAPAKSESGKPVDRLLAVRRSVSVKKLPVAPAQRARSFRQDGLSQWQSPTANLLRSAGDGFLRFVPPMNESAQKMKKFLANDLN